MACNLDFGSSSIQSDQLNEDKFNQFFNNKLSPKYPHTVMETF